MPVTSSRHFRITLACCSDTHGAVPPPLKGNIAAWLHGGDVYEGAEPRRDAAELRAWLSRQTVPVLAVRGNHDVVDAAEVFANRRDTRRAYRSDAERFLRFAARPLQQVTLACLQNYADSLTVAALAPATIHRMLSAVKSVLAFGHRIGYLSFDVGRPLRISSVRDTLNERVLDESEVQRILEAERHPRNSAILRLLYVAGVRVSELCSLKWKDVQARQDGGQITVMGKRGKTRSVLLPNRTWLLLNALRQGASEDAPVFQSRRKCPLHPSQVLRIVRRAAKRAGITKPVSPHWFRHAHASHSLDHNAPISLVQHTLGHADISTTGRYLHARPSDSSSRYLGE